METLDWLQVVRLFGVQAALTCLVQLVGCGVFALAYGLWSCCRSVFGRLARQAGRETGSLECKD